MGFQFRKKLVCNISPTEQKVILMQNVTSVYLKENSVILLNGDFIIHTFIEVDAAAAQVVYDQIIDFIYQGIFELVINTSTNAPTNTTEVASLVTVLGPNAPLEDNVVGVHLRAFNDDVDTVMGDLNHCTNRDWRPPTTAATLEIESSSQQDRDGGTGVNTLRIDGLDENFDTQNETITMNGMTAVTSTLQWFAINNVTVVLFGSNEAAVGTLTITNTDDNDVWFTLPSNMTKEFTGHYTVADGWSLFLKQYAVDAGQSGDFKAQLFGNPDGISFQTLSINLSHQNAASFNISPLRISERTTLKVQAERDPGGGGGRLLYIFYSGFLVRNSYFDSL